MQEIAKVKSAKVWSTSDGKAHDDKTAALRHQSVLNLRAWFVSFVDESTAVQIVDGIASDLDGFREVAQPLLAKPRAKRGSRTAAPTATTKAQLAA